MTKRPRLLHPLSALALSLLLTACASSRSDPFGEPATPQRPTFSSATTTTAEGTVEIEAGVDYDHNDAYGFPITLKTGVTEDLELFVGGVPYQTAAVSGGRDDRGRGDDLVGVRHRVWEDDDSALAAAYQLIAQFPTGSRTKGFSDDEYHVYGAGIVDGAIESLAWTAFYQYGSLGDPADSGRQSQHGFAFAVGHPLDDDHGAYAEVASVHTRARSENPLFLFTGLTRSTDPSIVYDLGGRFGLNDDGGDFAMTAGVTINFGRPRLRSQTAAAR